MQVDILDPRAQPGPLAQVEKTEVRLQLVAQAGRSLSACMSHDDAMIMHARPPTTKEASPE